jgi:hypothetical protein
VFVASAGADGIYYFVNDGTGVFGGEVLLASVTDIPPLSWPT